ncbi:MAG: protein-glutamate O-methyltransferase CheR [Acidobacteriota bacterium]|nr:protein-glutamate O-methyltransferase CheR [Acidobacteriota bacterium]
MTSQITPENYAFLQKRIYRDSGIVLDDSKLYLIESRLAPILESDRIATLNDLCVLLKTIGGASLRQRVVEAMTTNETLFFRDPPVFEALRKIVLPDLIERRRSIRKLSFWSAAASSGQEAYSLAMLLLEMGLAGWEIQIVGTDLNSQILDRARTGRYLQIEVNRGLPAPCLVKYFQRVGLEWQLSEQIRKMVKFVPFDLRQSACPMGQFDLVLCRNVLIYFDVETKKKILGQIRGSLFEKGYLVLGCAESTFNLDNAFTKQSIGPATFYQAP